MTRPYVFDSPPSGSVYIELLKLGCRLASEAVLVVAEPGRDPGAAISDELSVLRPFLIEQRLAREWPGTVSLVHPSTVYRYRTCPDLAIALASLRQGLLDWRHPEAPEDLSFVRANGRPLLVTTSHEGEAYLLLDDAERALVGIEFPALASALQPDG